MAKDLASLVVSLELQSAQYKKELDSANKKLKEFSKEGGESLKEFAGELAAYLSVEKLIEFESEFIKASAELADFSKSTGIAVEALSELQFAAKAGGVGSDQLNASLKGLNESISEAAGDGESTAATAFKLLGINVKDAAGNTKTADVVFKEMAQTFHDTEDGANKVALAHAVLKKGADALIPTLDKGVEGLNELAAAGHAAGAIIDGETAEAANAFNDKLYLLKATLIDGVGAQVEKILLPVLNDLTQQFLDTSKGGENVRVVSEEIAAAFKVLISVGLFVKEVFGETGDAIAGVFAAANAAIHGNFTDAKNILDDQSKHAADSYKSFTDQLDKVWTDAQKPIVAATEDTVKKVKTSLGSLAGAQAFQAAIKSLQSFVDGLQSEATKLDGGTVAATKYKLAHGDLAKALQKTGAAGAALAQQALNAAQAIDTQAVQKQVEGLKTQLDGLKGNTAEQAFDALNKQLKQTEDLLGGVDDATRASAQSTIDALRQQTAYQQGYLTLEQNRAKIEQDIAAQEQAINDARAAGQINDRQQQDQLTALREKQIQQIGQIVEGENAIATATGNPQMIQNVKALSSELDHLKAKSDEVTEAIRQDFESAFANNFSDLITGAKSFKDALFGFLKDIDKAFADLVAKQYAQQLFGAGTSAGSGPGAGSGLVSLLGGLFGGGGGGSSGISTASAAGALSSSGVTGDSLSSMLAGLEGFASGGTMSPGQVAWVGEKGPELAYAGSRNLNIIPNDKLGGGVTVHNQFVIQAPGGQISRQSQAQTAAAAARSIDMARSRKFA